MMAQDRLEFLKDRIDRCPFNQFNRICAVKADNGYAEITVELAPESMNIWGVVHGGLLFSAADVAVGLAAQTMWEGTTATISANVNYLRPGKEANELLAIAKVQKSGRTTGFFCAEVYDNKGQLLMTGQYVLHYS